MTAKPIRSLVIGAAVIATACLATAALAAKDKITLMGTYSITRLNASSTSVSMDFTATVSNTGPKDLSGKIALNDPAVIQKIFNQFGDQKIPAGGNVKLNASVTVPREEYDAWLSRGPNLTFYAQNDRGELKTFRIPLSGKAPAPSE